MSISILDPNKWSTDLMEQAKTQLVSALPQLQGAEQAVLEDGIKTFLSGMLPNFQAMAQTGEQTALNSLADRETQGLDWLTAFAAGNRLKGTAMIGSGPGATLISFTIESEPKEKSA